MKQKLSIAVQRYLYNMAYPYTNKKGVEIISYNGREFEFSAEAPESYCEIKELSLGIFIRWSNAEKLVEILNLSIARDIEEVSFESLYELYLKGKAEICCMFSDYLCCSLSFKIKSKNRMIVRDDDGLAHELSSILKDDKSIIKYVKHYYGLSHDLREIRNRGIPRTIRFWLSKANG